MAFEHDADLIEQIVLQRDPSFGGINGAHVQDGLRKLRQFLTHDQRDAFLLAAMQLLALARNGHSRIVPNTAIRIIPLRFVALGSGVYLTASSPEYRRFHDRRLIAVNDMPVDTVLANLSPFLAGTAQRQRVIGPLCCVWPAALQAVGAGSGTAPVRYELQDPGGRVEVLTAAQDGLVPAQSLYPYGEKGLLDPDAGLTPRFVACTVLATRVCHIALRDFYDPGGDAFAAELRSAIDTLIAHPALGLVVDMRGNPGGDFTRGLPLLHAISQHWRGQRCVVLTDKFTFSAAIVFVALLKHALKERMEIVGEAMGDDTRFHAEGDLIDLAGTGAKLRYSTAYHDWQTGTADASTPADIARQLVAAGDLRPDLPVGMSAPDKRQGRDPQLDAALACCLR